MKTSNKIILVLILAFVLSPVIAGVLILKGVEKNVEEGAAHEKEMKKNTFVIHPGDFRSIHLARYPETNVTITNNDSCRIVFNNINQPNLVYENNSGKITISRFEKLPYYKIVRNPFFKLYYEMKTPDIEFYAPNLNHVYFDYGDIKFNDYQCDTMEIVGNNMHMNGKIQTNLIKIRTMGSNLEFESSSASNANFNAYRKNRIIWGTVSDSVYATGFKDCFVKLLHQPKHLEFLPGSVINEMAVMIPDSTGKMVNVAAIFEKERLEKKQVSK